MDVWHLLLQVDKIMAKLKSVKNTEKKACDGPVMKKVVALLKNEKFICFRAILARYVASACASAITALLTVELMPEMQMLEVPWTVAFKTTSRCAKSTMHGFETL